jgi:hypothetical protein
LFKLFSKDADLIDCEIITAIDKPKAERTTAESFNQKKIERHLYIY